MSLFFPIRDSLFIPTLLQLLLPTEALFCHFRGLFSGRFSLDQLLGFLSGRNRCGPLWGRLRPRRAGLELETLWLPGLCLLSFLPPQTFLPSSHTQTFQDSQGRGSVHSRSGTPPAWSLGWALPLLLKDGAPGPRRGPLTTLSHSQGPQRRVESPLWDSFVPPHMCSFSHCDFALLPTWSGAGEELPRKLGLGQVLASLTFRDSCRKEGNGVFSPAALFLPPPPSLRAPWLAPAR